MSSEHTEHQPEPGEPNKGLIQRDGSGPTIEAPSPVQNEHLISHEFTIKGVALSVLKDLVSPLGADSTFHDVKQTILERTRSAKGNRSLASYLTQNETSSHLVQRADCFISYAWSGSAVATVNAIEGHFIGKPSPFVWIDIAMVDQHAAETTNVDFDQWVKTFRSSLEVIGSALIVLSPGEKPIAVSRSWCCFEWICIRQTNIRFDYCVESADEARLLESMKSGIGSPTFLKLFAGIDVEKATAFKKSDQDAIHSLLVATGVKSVNDIIMNSLKDWLLRVADEGLTRTEKGTTEEANLLNAKASLHQEMGEYKQALPLFEKALSIARDTQKTQLITAILNNLGGLLYLMGDYEKAEPIIREAAADREPMFSYLGGEEAVGFTEAYFEDVDYGEEQGDVMPEIANLSLVLDQPGEAFRLHGIALLLSAQGKYSEAEPVFRKAISIGEKTFGRDNPAVAAWLNNFAEVLIAKDETEEAEAMLREALATDRKALGDSHPHVGRDLNNLAKLLYSKGDLVAAAPLYREAIAVAEKTLGRKHPSVAAALSNLAAILQDNGMYGEAEALMREAVEIGESTLGRDHPDVATWSNNLGGLLYKQGKLSEAKQIFETVLTSRRERLGNLHSDVATSLEWMASVTRDEGDRAKALESAKEALAIYKTVLPQGHPIIGQVFNLVQSLS